MANEYVLERLKGIQEILNGAYRASAKESSATKGNEREQFINLFLSQVLPPPFRFGTGDATDGKGRRSGQLDVVVEFPFLPSLPIVGTNSRLYLADSIAAVIEVKSDVSAQWQEVLETAKKLALLEKDTMYALQTGQEPQKRIPLFAVGYTGWRNQQTPNVKLSEGEVDAILVIDQGIFVGKGKFESATDPGPWSLWGFIRCLHKATNTLNSVYGCEFPDGYAIVNNPV